MKRGVLFGILVLLASGVFAGTELKDSCRKILYAVKPVDAIANLDDATLLSLHQFALGIPVKDQEPLTRTDAYLFSWLSNTEFARREKTPDEFSLYLQERREQNQPYVEKMDSEAIKINGWIDLFQLNLLFNS